MSTQAQPLHLQLAEEFTSMAQAAERKRLASTPLLHHVARMFREQGDGESEPTLRKIAECMHGCVRQIDASDAPPWVPGPSSGEAQSDFDAFMQRNVL